MTDHIVDTNEMVRAEFEEWALKEKPELLIQYQHNTPSGIYWQHLATWQAATQRQQARLIAELEAQVQALSLDAARYQFATAYNDEGRLNFKAIYDAWDGDGSFTDQIDAAIAAGNGEA